MIESKKLLHFVTIAKTGNFNEAAELLHISQPALSRSIQSLENRLNLMLFDRSHREIKLTTAGEHLLKHAQSALLQLENFMREGDRIKSLTTGKLVVGTGPLPADQIGAMACAAFLQHHPNIELSLQVDDPTSMAVKLIKGEIDVLIADLRGIEDSSDLSWQPLPSIPVTTVARSGHPLAAQKNVHLEQLEKYPLGTISKLAKKVMGNVLGIQSDEENNQLFSYECNNAQLMLTTVKHSDTIGILLTSNVAKELERQELCVIDVPAINNQLSSQYGVITYKPRLLSLAAERFIEIVHQVAVKVPG